MAGQRPQTTVLKLIDVARDLGLGEALVPPEIVRTVHSARAALTDDGRVEPGAVAGALWLVRDVTLPGTPPVGPIPWLLLDFPDGARIHRVRLRAGTAPGTGSCALWLTVNGADAESVAIPKGATANAEPGVALAVPPGGTLGARVVATNGAADLLLSIHYTNGGA